MTLPTSIPDICWNDHVLAHEALTFAEVIYRQPFPQYRRAVAAYGHRLEENIPVTKPVLVNFYHALTFTVCKLPGYVRHAQALKDYPGRLNQFEEAIARDVYLMLKERCQ